MFTRVQILQTLGKAAMLGLILSTVYTPVSHAGQALPISSTNVSCVNTAPAELKLLQRLTQTNDRPQVEIYTHRCNGGLYFKTSDLAAPHIVHEGWWLHEYIASVWLDTQKLSIRARFYTGVGPDGTRPFDADIHLRHTAGGWSVDEPHLRTVQFARAKHAQLEGLHRKAYFINNLEAWHNTRLSRELSDLKVNFEDQRLILVPLMLSSGSKRVENVRILSGASRYAISWQINTPSIGTMDMNPTLIWVVLPNDGRPLHVTDRARGVSCAQCSAGVSHHTYVYATPSTASAAPIPKISKAIDTRTTKHAYH